MWRVHGIIFPPEEKIRFSGLGELCSLSYVSSLPFQEQGLLLVAKGEGQNSQDLGPMGLSPVRSCRHCSSIPDGSRKKQKPELPHAGDQEQNK